MARQVLENGVILPAEYSDDWYDDMTSNLTKLDDVIGSDSGKLSSSDVGAAALSNNYNDLDNLPTIPTVNDATLTIQKNGVDVQTFTANASSNVTANITVPTKTSDLTNDSNFVDTSNPAVSSGITSAKVTDYDTHIADTDKHVTTADKNKWNNQTYVFRYSSTALVASSTNSNALLDNTDNLKVGDKVIDSSGVLFSITAIDTQNSTFTIGTALIDLAQDSDVVHKSGNETVAGIKNFTDYTYIRALNFTNAVASPSSSDSAVMPIVTTVTYTDQSPSQTARLNFRVTADGVKSLYPHENNQYALGLTSRKWSEIHATTYYYGSSDTEFSQKFVTTDTNQDISANKNFKGLITTTPDSPLWSVTNNTTADITSLALNCIHIEGRAAGSLSDLSGGAWYVAQIGTGCFFFRHNAGTDVRYKHFPTNVVSKLCLMSNDNKFISDLCPNTTNSYNLGDSTNKWATINGLNPSSLSMPDLSNRIDISSYITHLDKVVNQYTPPVNGYINIRVKKTSLPIVSIRIQQNYGLMNSSETADFSIWGTCLPVVAGQIVEFYISADSLMSAFFFPCQGNV